MKKMRRFGPFEMGFLVNMGPLLMLVSQWVSSGRGLGVWLPSAWVQPLLFGLCLVHMSAVFFLARFAFWVRFILSCVGLLGSVILAPYLFFRPGLSFLLLLGFFGLMVWFWLPEFASARQPKISKKPYSRFVSGAFVSLLILWLISVPMGLAKGIYPMVTLLISVTITSLAIVRWAYRPFNPSFRFPLLFICIISVLQLVLVLFGLWHYEIPISSLLLVPSVGFVLSWRGRSSQLESDVWWHRLVENPSAMLVSTFLLTGCVGGLVLAIPFCAQSLEGISPIDAFFTAFSACCVTGLAVRDTATEFSFMGQFIVLVLIQIGGLGIMSFSSAAFALLGRRMSLRHEASVAELLNEDNQSQLFGSLKRLFLLTGACELAGALVLTLLFFQNGDHLGKAIWRGIFTSISAFCNAGFSLQTESLIPYQSEPAILGVISILIIIGGLGPVVLVAMPHWIRGRRSSVHVRMVLFTSLVLLIVPMFLFLIVESHNALRGMGPLDQLMNAWFHAVTLRTAGFNSINMAGTESATFTLMLFLMFVGGSPGSTAGGIKTTTLAVMVLAMWGALRGRNQAQAFGFSIPHESVYKALAVTTMGFLTVGVALMALQLTQNLPYEQAIFEVFSAVGTVGLSVGGTAQLDRIGKVIIICCMFAGRVGPLTLFLFLTRRHSGSGVGYPSQDVAIG
ncbi:MAG: hypothetical protein H6510_04895 [Acidobacteria bacterium]|nr:hypothetical protein [Acidobacteriota bacterium]